MRHCKSRALSSSHKSGGRAFNSTDGSSNDRGAQTSLSVRDPLPWPQMTKSLLCCFLDLPFYFLIIFNFIWSIKQLSSPLTIN